MTGNDARPADIADGATATAERERLESRLDDIEERVAELEAATQAVRGYAGAVRAVNREVERRADLALSRATAAERGSDGGARDRGTGDDAATTPGGDAGDPRSRPGDATPTADGAVPSESALDAALPDDRPSSGDRDGGDGRGGRGGGQSGEDGSAWAEDALSRLRESL